MPHSTSSRVVKVSDVYKEYALFYEKQIRWYAAAAAADFYAFSHPGTAWPIDLAFWESVAAHTSDGLELWFQFGGGAPFIRMDFQGWIHLPQNIEARQLEQKKRRLRGIFKRGGYVNKMNIRLPHR